MAEQFYIKKNGKYVPHNDPYALEGLTQGAWLIVVNRNCTSIKRQLKPKFAELDAAIKYLEEGLSDAIREAEKLRPQSDARPLSKKEQKAWDKYREMMGNDMPLRFYYASTYEIAEKAGEYVRKIMEECGCDIEEIKKRYPKIVKESKSKNAILELEV